MKMDMTPKQIQIFRIIFVGFILWILAEVFLPQFTQARIILYIAIFIAFLLYKRTNSEE